MSQTFKAKFHRSIAVSHSQLEDSVASALLDIENSSTDLKSELRNLQIAKATELTLTSKSKKERRVIVVFVPYPNSKIVQKSHKKKSFQNWKKG